MKLLQSVYYDSPLGKIRCLFDADRLCYLDYANNDDRMTKMLTTRYRKFSITPGSDLLGIRARLDCYFAGRWDAFDGLDLCTDGTDFRRTVWSELRKIPVGQTTSYLRVARNIDQPNATRAVGNANAHNPICIIIPCHRVIRTDGLLGGYAGGVKQKKWLLTHEGMQFD